MTPEHQAIIDQALQELAQNEQAQASVMGRPGEGETRLEALRQSPLEEWLTQLAHIAEQGSLGSIGQKEARDMLDGIYHIFCQAPFHPYPLIPPKFDKSPLGSLLNEARIHTLGFGDVVNVAEAAKRTQAQRAQIYFLIFGGILHPLEINGKTMIERRELERVEEYKRETSSRSPKEEL